jgi:vitamin B12 transporter
MITCPTYRRRSLARLRSPLPVPRDIASGVAAALVCSIVLSLCAVSLVVPSEAASQEDSFSLEGLVVTASPTALAEDAVANHVTVLTGARLGLLGSRPLSDALRGVPGLDVVRGGSFGAVTSVFLRGGESDHTLVLVDGVQVNQAGGGFDFSELTTDNVERVEIVRGPASALYGSDAVSGVIHVITRTGTGAARGSLRLEGGTFGRRDWAADLQGGAARAGYSVALARRATDGVLDLNNRNHQTVLSGNARLLPDDRTSVAVTLRLSDREYHFPTDGSGAAVDENQFTYSDGTTARLAVRRAVTGALSVEALLAINEADGGTDDQPDAPADTLGFYGFTSLDHFRRATGELRAHLALDPAVVTAGFEYEEERQRSFSETLSSFGPSQGRSESERLNLGYFLHAAGSVQSVAFSGGGRLEDNERFGRIVSWQAGATWRAPGGWGTLVRASVGRAIKEPTFFENFATGFALGNPDLDPERSRSWEAGIEQALVDGALTLRATWFDQEFGDLIQYTGAPPALGDPNFYNVAEASSRGMEIDVDGRRGVMHGGASWTWLDTKVLDAGFDEGAGATFVEGERLIRRPSHTASVRAGVSLADVTVTAEGRFVGKRDDRDFATFPASPTVLPSYALVSVGGTWTISHAAGRRPGFALEVRSENLLDEAYQEVLGFRAPGRGIYVGGRVMLGGS